MSAFCHLLNITKRARDLDSENEVLSQKFQSGMIDT
jgi:hypothetical protein